MHWQNSIVDRLESSSPSEYAKFFVFGSTNSSDLTAPQKASYQGGQQPRSLLWHLRVYVGCTIYVHA
jgi:hypothetical protein